MVAFLYSDDESADACYAEGERGEEGGGAGGAVEGGDCVEVPGREGMVF